MTLIFGLLLLLLYFVPAIMAFHKKKKDAWAIAIANLLIGWSGIGWFFTLYLAVKKD